MKKMRLRRDDQCSVCGVELVATTEAWWDATAKEVTCVGCQGAQAEASARSAESEIDPLSARGGTTEDGEPVVLPAEAEAAALAALERGKAGASARAEGERRSKKREDGIRTKHPRIGGVVLALTDDPSTTKVWAKGAAGEERVGGRLEEARQQGIEVLHDRRIPGSKANIDHLAITPSGVWVVDAKRYTGKLERRDVGGRFETDPRLYVNGRDKSKLVEGVEWQMSKVRDAVIGGDFESVPIHGALCFVDTEFGFFAKPFVIGSVSVTWGRKLIAPMLEPVLLGPPAIARLTLLLAERLPVK